MTYSPMGRVCSHRGKGLFKHISIFLQILLHKFSFLSHIAFVCPSLLSLFLPLGYRKLLFLPNQLPLHFLVVSPSCMQSDFHTHHSNWNCSKVTNNYLLQNLHFSQLLYNTGYQWSLLNSLLATSIKISPIFPNLFWPLSLGFLSTACTLILTLLSAHAFSSWSTTSSWTISSISAIPAITYMMFPSLHFYS